MGNAPWKVEKNASAILLKLRQSENLILVCLAKVTYSCTQAGKWPRADTAASNSSVELKKWNKKVGRGSGEGTV